MKILFALLLTLLPIQLMASVETSIDPDTHLRKWAFRVNTLELELVQRLPDQTRGFFIARGFTTAQADQIAERCVFQTIVRNTGETDSAETFSIDLKYWQVRKSGRSLAIPTMQYWAQEWDQQNTAQSAKVAFRWATFPMQQIYAAGDYNWGMVIFGPKPGEHFDLGFNWTIAGKKHKAMLKDIECAPDVDAL